MGGEGLSLVERLSPSFHYPWLSVVAVLVVVSSIPPGDFFFYCLENLLFWWPGGRATRDFGPPEKTIVGYNSHRSGKHTQTPKSALLALKTTRVAIAVWAVCEAGVRQQPTLRSVYPFPVRQKA